MEKFFIALLIIVILGLYLANYFNFQIPNNLSTLFQKSTQTTGETKTVVVTVPGQNIKFSEASMYIPGVDSEGKGVITLLKVRAIPGDGKILVDIKGLGFFVDTQQSIRTAVDVAAKNTGINISAVDLMYTIEGSKNTSAGFGLVEGPSAGAALTITTIAALENKELNKSVVITGTINPDGSIGKIGGVPEKIAAGKSVNATLFLVPEGQGLGTTVKPVRECQKVGPIKYCVTEYREEKVDVSKELGITVKEISDIKEALKYFIS